MDEWHNVCAPARLPWGVLRAGPAVDQSIAQSVLWLGIGELLGQSISGQFTSCEFLAQIPALRENCFLILGLGRCPWYYRGRTWPRFLFFQVFWGVDSLWVRLASGKILLDSWGRFQRPVSSSGKILPLPPVNRQLPIRCTGYTVDVSGGFRVSVGR